MEEAVEIAYVDEVLADSPFFYYRMDETVGPTAADETTNNHDGTYVSSGSGPTFEEPAAAAALGTAVLFSQASSEHVITPASASSAGSLVDTGYTVEAWFRTTTSSFWSSICGVYNDADGTAFQFTLNSQNTDDLLRMFVRDSNGGASATISRTDAGLNDGNWHHLVVRDTPSDGTDRGLFIDGAAVTFTSSGTLGANTTSNFEFPLAIASTNVRGTPGDFFDGALDEVAIYDHILSDARILAHFNAAFATGIVDASGLGAARSAGLASAVVVAASATGLGAARSAGLASSSALVSGSGLGASRAAGLASATVLPYVARDMTLEVGPTSPSMMVAESVIAGSVEVGPTETERVP